MSGKTILRKKATPLLLSYKNVSAVQQAENSTLCFVHGLKNKNKGKGGEVTLMCWRRNAMNRNEERKKYMSPPNNMRQVVLAVFHHWPAASTGEHNKPLSHSLDRHARSEVKCLLQPEEMTSGIRPGWYAVHPLLG